VAACVVTQQYSSATFVSLHFHSHKEKSGAHFKNIFFIFSPPVLKLHKYHHHHHHWLDSPWWALAFLRSFAQSSLSRAIFFQFLTTNILISWLHEYEIVKREIA